MKATFRLVKENVRNLEPCVHGGDVWDSASKVGFREDEILDFSSSVNPLGASEKAVEAVKANLVRISSYPDSNSTELRRAIANRFEGVSKDNVVAGNGSAELIYLFAETFLTKGDVALIPAPTFSEYERAVRKTGAETKHVKPKRDFHFSNPNNPTSVLTPLEQLAAIVERAIEENVLVFLDEDFLEFVDQEEQLSFIGKVGSYPNLFVLRSFTKIFGLTGLRIGYGVASEEMTDILLNAKIPWNVNCLAQAAAITALEDEDHLKRTRELIKVEKAFLTRGLTRIEAFKVFPADANFFFIDVRQSGCTAAQLKKKMLQHGILVRDCSSFQGLDKFYVRVAVKTRPENEKLLDAFRKTVKSCA